jgi:hypothetical protein
MNNIQNILKLLYFELDEIRKTENHDDPKKVFKHNRYEKSHVKEGHNGIYRLPITNDIISMIYNSSIIPITFYIILHNLAICEFTIQPKEYVYPLYNKSIFPLFLFSEDNYPSIKMENNEEIVHLNIVCSDFNSKQRKNINFDDFYYLENNDHKYDVIYRDVYHISHDIIDNHVDNLMNEGWVNLTHQLPIVVKI